MRRELIGIGQDLVNVAYDAPIDASPREQIEDAERRLYKIAETGRYDGGFQSFTTAAATAVDLAAKAYQRDGHLSGIATGLLDLDFKMGGLQRSDLVIIAGRPAMGKTALATNIAFNIARAYRHETKPDGTKAAIDGGIVGFFSLEMSAEQLATRVIAERSGVASSKMRRGDVSEADFQRIVETLTEIQHLPLYTSIKPAAFQSPTLAGARAAIEAAKRFGRSSRQTICNLLLSRIENRVRIAFRP